MDHILLSYMTEFRADLERLSLKTIKKNKKNWQYSV